MNRKALKTVLLIQLLTLSSLSFLSLILLDRANASPSNVFLSPDILAKEVGETFTIDINVTYVAGVHSWSLKLGYDSSILTTTLSSIEQGPYLSSVGVTFFPKTEETIGSTYILLSCILTDPNAFKSGAGKLASITFQVSDNGMVELRLFETEFKDKDNNLLLDQPLPLGGFFYTTTPRASFYYLPSRTAAPDYTPDPALRRDPVIGENVTFNASSYMIGSFFRGSYDADGSIVKYTWNFGDGTAESYIDGINITAIAKHIYTENKTYAVSLTVTDDTAKTDTYSEFVSVLKHDLAINSIEVSPTTASIGEQVSIKVTVTNLGSERENFNVTAYYYNTTHTSLIIYNRTQTEYKPAFSAFLEKVKISGSDVKIEDLFTAGTHWNVTFTWNTTGLSLGQYSIKVNVTLMKRGSSTESMNQLDSNATNNEMILENHVTLTKLHNLAITEIKISPTIKTPAVILYGTSQVTVNVTVSNTGDNDETFYVTLHQDSTFLYNWTDVFLAQKAAKVLQYTWNTATLPIGNYTLRAQASNVTGEVEQGRTNDNTLTLKASIVTLPVASFTYTPAKPTVNQLVTFDGTSSHAATGWTIASYRWKYDDFSPPELPDPTSQYAFPLKGNRNVTLIVTDSLGLTANTTQSIYVGVAPTASFSYLPSKPFVGGQVTFDASGSHADTGLTIATYTWAFNRTDTVTQTEAVYQRAFSATGTYNVTLTVADNYGLKDSATQFIFVGVLPTAQFTHVPQSPKADENVNFDATQSVANGGTIESYKWSFGDGNTTTVTSPTIGHVFAKGGNFSVALTVIDSEGLNTTITKYVVVAKLSTTVSILTTPTSFTVGATTTISGQISPAVSRGQVTILYRQGNFAWSMLTIVLTDRTGSYIHNWQPTTAGTYELKATWTGDDKYTGNESNTVTINVQGQQQQQIPTDILYAGIGAIAIIVIVVAVFLLRRRK